jgi:hypothetical protein
MSDPGRQQPAPPYPIVSAPCLHIDCTPRRAARRVAAGSRVRRPHRSAALPAWPGTRTGTRCAACGLPPRVVGRSASWPTTQPSCPVLSRAVLSCPVLSGSRPSGMDETKARWRAGRSLRTPHPLPSPLNGRRCTQPAARDAVLRPPQSLPAHPAAAHQAPTARIIVCTNKTALLALWGARRV